MEHGNEHEAGPATPLPQHTPGPWFYDPGFGEVVTAERKTPVSAALYVASETIVAESVTRANGLLIAAAPDLLAALKRTLPYVHDYAPQVDSWADFEVAQAAIAKAEGREQ